MPSPLSLSPDCHVFALGAAGSTSEGLSALLVVGGSGAVGLRRCLAFPAATPAGIDLFVGERRAVITRGSFMTVGEPLRRVSESRRRWEGRD